jgi:hypothetical protein
MIARALAVVAACAAAFAVALGGAACQSTSACRAGTLLVTFRYAGAAASATQVQVRLDVGSAHYGPRVVARAGASETGTLEIDFASGYPAGQTAALTAVALDDASQPLATATAAITLVAGCTAAQLDFTTAGAPDLASAADAADAAGPPPDLSTLPDGAAGILTFTVTTGPANVNLTTEGTADWSHFGFNNAGDWNHKDNIIVPAIPPPIITGNSNRTSDTTGHTFTWTDGTPTLAAAMTHAMLFVNGNQPRVQLTVPVSATPRVLTLYVGGQRSTAELGAALSDGSAPVIIDGSQGNTSGKWYAVYTITFGSPTPSTTLGLSWRLVTAGGGTSAAGINLGAATLH